MIGKYFENELTREVVLYVATIIKNSLLIFVLGRIKFQSRISVLKKNVPTVL